MYVISCRNVCEALPAGLAFLAAEGQWENSRAGRVIVASCPVTTIYHNPRERVLFSALRDANPTFHLAEACWMLAGRRDAAFLNNFVKDFGARFAEPDGNIHDAYGHRWRNAFGFDQLDAVVRQLSTAPGSRQAVIQMWDCRDNDGCDYNVGEIAEDLWPWRTRPCNTHVYLRIRTESGGPYDPLRVQHLLDITVCCRSNDVVWGAYGANAVHMSVLQEYLAARLDVGVGRYYQVSNNYHCYEDQWKKLTEPHAYNLVKPNLDDNRYAIANLTPQPLVHDAESFDEEVKLLLGAYEADGDPEEQDSMFGNFHNNFLSTTVWPMLMAHRAHKRKDSVSCNGWLHQIEASDWRVACTEWIERRRAK